ncbi:MAG TPA: hypothetical protein PKO15_02410 [Fibrobacteria bacterium]|nr:hypothetical protein [Fibrobacteria bacterium]HOX50165.1 hypothetical protein [Fibrobacteria bacterium]
MIETDELERILEELEATYAPFRDAGAQWRGDPEGLDEVVRRRQDALEAAQPLVERIQGIWKRWESNSPSPQERSRIFAARNRIVEMGMQVSKADVALQEKARRKSETLRRDAADSGRKHKASKAYMGGRVGL